MLMIGVITAENHRNNTETNYKNIHFKYIFKHKRVILSCINNSQNYCFYCVFDQINSAMVSIF